MGTYFGTDGIRGAANTELSPELAFRVGRFGGYVLTRERQGGRPRIVIGKDTRISGDMLEAALVAGLLSIGADVLQAGVIPTPGVAYLTKTYHADAGIMISASHNPLGDNGIKLFGADGFKLSDRLEAEIEAFLAADSGADRAIGLAPRPVGSDIGTLLFFPEGAQQYVSHLRSTARHRFDGLRVAIDCANGAASMLAPRLFEALGAETIPLANEPNGLNINEGCGSTSPDFIRNAVLERKAHLGLSFDGDADRLIAVDENGDIVDGDRILFVLARAMANRGRLHGNAVVTTEMSNLGFEKALQERGIDVVKSKVGDRYVMERMLGGGYNLGGEPSGHMILLDYATTGDGMLTAVQLLDVMVSEGKTLSELTAGMTAYPQLLLNVPVQQKRKLAENENILKAIRETERRLGDAGRVLVRPSGTEPLVRVMVEGPDERELPAHAERIAATIRSELSYSAV
ncbi:phosphoglucosamine mutase [Paenibacillus sp.]|uniref:phosphoglucosamine mutase n=1 Tax=Paenibacillus sp. TaxID=58172 RepID=UPI002810EF98|nr:phosphoglucosamine mutase [Paenibacillus sp.]